MVRITFRCALCDENKPVGKLSQASLDLAETKNIFTALATLPAVDKMCSDCCTVDVGEPEPVFGTFPSERSEYERNFELDGLSVAQATAYAMSY
jgi:hypothetical protein